MRQFLTVLGCVIVFFVVLAISYVTLKEREDSEEGFPVVPGRAGVFDVKSSDAFRSSIVELAE